MLERHYLETFSFVTNCFIVHEERLNLRVAFPLRGYCFSDYSLWLAILPYFAVHAATIRTRSVSLQIAFLTPFTYNLPYTKTWNLSQQILEYVMPTMFVYVFIHQCYIIVDNTKFQQGQENLLFFHYFLPNKYWINMST